MTPILRNGNTRTIDKVRSTDSIPETPTSSPGSAMVHEVAYSDSPRRRMLETAITVPVHHRKLPQIRDNRQMPYQFP